MSHGSRVLPAVLPLVCLLCVASQARAQDTTQVKLAESTVSGMASSASATFVVDLRLRVTAGDTIVLHTCQGSLRYQVLTYEPDGSVGDLLQRSYCPLAYAGAEEVVGPTQVEHSVPIVVQLGERSLWFISKADLEGPLTLALAAQSRHVLATPPFQVDFQAPSP